MNMGHVALLKFTSGLRLILFGRVLKNFRLMEHPIDALTALATEMFHSEGCIQEVGFPGNGELAEIAGSRFVAHGVYPRALRLRVPSMGLRVHDERGESRRRLLRAGDQWQLTASVTESPPWLLPATMRLEARMRAILRAPVRVALTPIWAATAGRRMIDAKASPVPTMMALGAG
jgi:hypothetical protein